MAVDLSGVKQLCDTSVASVLEHCPGLESLSVRRCSRLRGSDAAWHWLDNDPSLTALNLSYCHALRDNLVGLVARCCPRLRSLELAGCKRVTNSAIRSLAGEGAVESLTALDLGHLKSVTAVAIRDLLERKPKLLTLNLGGAKFATDAVINGLAVGAPHCRIYRR